jgi:UDP-3-O-[3-hydroxymyristoyl] glucosamine N-acyltransferase
VVGGEGFGFAAGPSGHLKIPQAGVAVVEDDVEIGVNSCVDRAAVGVTRVAQGAKLDNLVQVGHGAHVGPHTRMVAYAGVAGSTHLGANVVLAAKAAVLGHLTIGDGVQVGVCSAVHNDQPDGARVTGVPAITHAKWLRAAASFSEIPDLVRKLRDLESRIISLEGRKK